MRKIVAVIVLSSLFITGCGQYSESNSCCLTISKPSPDNREDQTAKLQNWLDQVAQNGGGSAFLPSGRYRIDGSITVPTGVILTGSWSAPHHGLLEKGTVIDAYGGRGSEEGPALFELSQSSGVKGITIIYPEQKLDNVQAYPWTFHGKGMHNTIENVTLVNSYNGICIGPENNELHLIKNVYGCVLRRGIMIDNTTDIGRIENVHFNPHYWYRSGHKGMDPDLKPNPEIATAFYMQENLEAFIFGRTDWQYVTNTFVFGAKIGYKFIETENGSFNGQLLGPGADMCRYGVFFEQSNSIGTLITNGQFVAGVLKRGNKFDTYGIYTSPDFEGSLNISNCSFWGKPTSAIMHQGPGNLSVSQMITTAANIQKAAIQATGGNLIVTDSLLGDHELDALIGPDVNSVTIKDNISTGKFDFEDSSGKAVFLNNN